MGGNGTSRGKLVLAKYTSLYLSKGYFQNDGGDWFALD